MAPRRLAAAAALLLVLAPAAMVAAQVRRSSLGGRPALLVSAPRVTNTELVGHPLRGNPTRSLAPRRSFGRRAPCPISARQWSRTEPREVPDSSIGPLALGTTRAR
jgi:hypothetical protein